MKVFNKLLMVALTTAGVSCSNSPQSSLHGIDKSNMDTTMVPGNDFDQYANGGWKKTNPLTPEYARYGIFDKLRESNQAQLKSLIEEMASKTNEAGSIAKKIGDLYNIGMDSATLNQQGAAPLMADIQRIEAMTDVKEVTMLLAELNKIGISPFFGSYVYADDMNSSINIFHISQGGYSMGDRDYYLLQDETTKNIRSAYEQMMQNLFILCGYDSDDAQQKVRSVMNFETALAKAALSREEMRNPYNNYHKMSSEALQTMVPAIEWDVYFNKLGLPKVDSLNVAHPQAMSEVNRLLCEAELQDIKNYMEWEVILSASSYLSNSFVDETFEFYGKVLSGKTEQRPRWKRVVDVVNGSLGELVGQIYVEKYFPHEAKAKMDTLVHNLQLALGERIKGLEWMSGETKEKALEKLNTFYPKIGYPDKWRDYSALDIKADSYWDNVKRSNVFEHNFMISKFNKPLDKTEWLMTPQTVNAYYNPATNEICFPAAILQSPFFDVNAQDALNYGAIGVVIGHEMTHGFDDQGRQYDKEGNLKDWWTKEDAEQFNARAKVMEDYFNNITILDSVKANGKFTLGENIADYGGITISLAAYKKIQPNMNEVGPDGFTALQSFLLAYANVWAGNARDEEMLRLTKVDPHSLGRWRVNGILPHIDAFYEAFNVGEGNTMYMPKEKRVAIW